MFNIYLFVFIATNYIVSCNAIQIYNQCTVPGTVAITFDDGPFSYTQEIVDQFNAVNGKVTFFVNGMNFGCIYDYASALQNAFNSGHQIASHTWSHPDLILLSLEQVQEESLRLNTALQKIIGVSPTFIRPPYGSYNDATVAALNSVGFTVFSLWTLDSGDSLGITVQEQQNRLSVSTGDKDNVLFHETSEAVSRQMIPYVISWAQNRNLRMVTVGECLGMNSSTWYTSAPVASEIKNPSWVC